MPAGKDEPVLTRPVDDVPSPGHLPVDVVLDCCQILRFDAGFRGQPVSERRYAVLLFPFVDFGLGAIRLGISLPVPAVAVGFAFDERGTGARSRGRYRRRYLRMHVQHIGAVRGGARHGIGFGPLGDVPDGLMLGLRCRLRVPVVFAYEDNGQLPDAAEIERFMEAAFVRCPVAEETECHFPVGLKTGRQS